MSGNENENNSSSNKSETVTISSDDPQKIKDLEKQLKEKQAELNEEKKNAGIEISKLKKETQLKEAEAKLEAGKKLEAKKENLGTRNSVQHGSGYHNAYANGTYKKELEKLKKEKELAKRGIVAPKN